MAAVPITLIGSVTYDNGSTQQVTFQGVAALSGLGVGGGPAEPPPYPSQGPGFPTHPIAPGGKPPGIWGGPPLYPDQGLPGQPPFPSQGPGFPTPPIYLPPVQPGGPPLVIWGPGDPRPQPPIHLPPEPPDVSPAPPGTSVKPPPADGGWAYVERWGWGYFPGPTDTGPKG